MKRIILTLTMLCACTLLMAQEEYHEEYRIHVGDTILWHPFIQCSNISFKVSSKDIVHFEPIQYGTKVLVIGAKVGLCHLKATCGDVAVSADITVEDTPKPSVNNEPIEKPQTQPFTATYQFNPPADHFFITFTNPYDDYRETYAKIGNEEAYNNGHGTDRFWNTETGSNYYYVPDSQGWTDDVKFDFEPFGESFYPLNAFAHEVDTEGDLSSCYIGTEKVLDIDCWVFFMEQDNQTIRYWVDPANGCTLRRQVNNENPSEVTVYDLQYTRWFFGPRFKKSLHDKTR